MKTTGKYTLSAAAIYMMVQSLSVTAINITRSTLKYVSLSSNISFFKNLILKGQYLTYVYFMSNI